jgi:hypothetical protein
MLLSFEARPPPINTQQLSSLVLLFLIVNDRRFVPVAGTTC